MSGFTEKRFKFDEKGSSNGQGIDFSKDFKIINSQRLTGEFDGINIKHLYYGLLKIHALHLSYFRFILCL
jgi:hypothetical protein